MNAQSYQGNLKDDIYSHPNKIYYFGSKMKC